MFQFRNIPTVLGGRLTRSAHPPPAAMKHPVAARSPNIPVTAPSGRPEGIKYPSKQIHNYSIERFSFECEKVIGFAFAIGFHAT